MKSLVLARSKGGSTSELKPPEFQAFRFQPDRGPPRVWYHGSHSLGGFRYSTARLYLV